MTILPIVIHDDIELWATGRLRSLLATRPEPHADSVFVSNTVPSTRRPRMVIIRRDGGGRLDAVRESPRLGVRVFVKAGATAEQEANDLGRLVAALLAASPDGNPVSRVNITGGPYAVDEDSGDELRYITCELISKGHNL
jgi:hypothetical protein